MINGEAGDDLAVDTVEEMDNSTKEMHSIMILDIANSGFGGK